MVFRDSGMMKSTFTAGADVSSKKLQIFGWALLSMLLSAMPRGGSSAGQFRPDKYGVGAVFVQADSTGPVTVKDCSAGGPAQLAGLLPGDRLLSLDGVLVSGWSFAKVIDYLRGERPDTVRITVLRDSTKISVRVVRARFSDIAARSGLRYVPTRDSLRFMMAPVDEKAQLTVGSLLEPTGLKDIHCNDAKLILPARAQTFLYFWASWCGPCKMLIQQLEAQRQDVVGRTLNIVGLNVDNHCDLFRAAADSLHPLGEQYWAGGWYGDLPQAFRVYRRGIPTGALIDGEGRLIAVSTGTDSVLLLFKAALSNTEE